MKDLKFYVIVFSIIIPIKITAQGSFRVWPYLQNPAPDAMSIHWISESEAPGILYWHEEGVSSENSQTSVPIAANALQYPDWESTTYFNGNAPKIPYSHRIRLESLKSGTIYHYKVIQALDTFESTFKTAPAGNDSIRFIVYADCETEPESTGKPAKWTNPVDGSVRKYLVDQTTGYSNNLTVIRSRHPDLVLIAGDITQHGGEQRDWDEFWKHNTSSVANKSLAGHIPLLTALGNHDYYEGPQMGKYSQPGSERAISKYLTYFEDPLNNSPNKRQEGRYYCYQYGPATIIVLDACNNSPNGTNKDTNFYLLGENDSGGGNAPDFDPESRQYSWLEEKLKQAQKNSLFTFVMFHHIPYSSGPHGYLPGVGSGFDNQSGAPTRVLTPLLMKYGVDAVFCGHDEMWERSEVTGDELLPNGNEVNHTIQFYDVGIGGDGLRGLYEGTNNSKQKFLAHTDAPEKWDGGILVSGGKHYGHLEVNISPVDSETWEAVLTPSYVFPLYNKNNSAYTDFERRVYDDEIILTSKVLSSTSLEDKYSNSSFSSRIYPNPFSTSTTIEFVLKNSEQVEVSIYDVEGKRVRTLGKGIYSAGSHSVVWNGKNNQDKLVMPGLYFYTIQNERGDKITGKITFN